MSDKTLPELEAEHERLGDEVRVARNRMERAREKARIAHSDLVVLEAASIDVYVDPLALQEARKARDGAMANLAEVEGRFHPSRRSAPVIEAREPA